MQKVRASTGLLSSGLLYIKKEIYIHDYGGTLEINVNCETCLTHGHNLSPDCTTAVDRE